MIINKTYEINYINLDSVVLEIANDIKNGYTFKQIERPPLEFCTHNKDIKPTIIITLHNKKVDEII